MPDMAAECCDSDPDERGVLAADAPVSRKPNRLLCSIAGHWPKRKSLRHVHYNWRGMCALCGTQIVKLEPSGSWRTFDRVKWVDPRLDL
jgi:hypothetical protein